MRVREVMTREPRCCTALCSAQDAAALMRQWNVGALAVVDSFYNRKLLGMVTDRDLCLAVVATGRPPNQVRIGECMTQNPVGCAPEHDVIRALQLMCERHVHRLPVLNADQTVVGMVSVTDLIRYRAVSPQELAEAMPQIGAAAEVVSTAEAV